MVLRDGHVGEVLDLARGAPRGTLLLGCEGSPVDPPKEGVVFKPARVVLASEAALGVGVEEVREQVEELVVFPSPPGEELCARDGAAETTQTAGHI